MKKLLLLTNILCLFFLLGSCQNVTKPKNENSTAQKPAIKDTAVAIDTVKAENMTPASGTVGTGTGIVKDTTGNPTKGRAVVHPTPDKNKIDSIKKEKQKTKK